MINADKVEELAISALKGLLADRIQVKQAILSPGLYSDETRRLLRKGSLARRRFTAMGRPELRSLFLAIVSRAEAGPTGLTMHLSCFELSRFLGWDGIGVFQKSFLRPSRAADRVHELHAPPLLICGHPYFALPIEPNAVSHGEPNQTLVELVKTAGEYRDFVLANRSRDMVDLAHEKGMGTSHFARLLRLNYLAPDIQAAIVDGRQPASLTR
jgi:site-specific DNA recombinase